MKKAFRVEVPEKIVRDSFEKALSFDEHSRGNFFHDIRRAFKEEIEDLLIRNGISVKRYGFLNNFRWRDGAVIEREPIIRKRNGELGVKSCAKYGTGDYSLEAINRIDRWYGYGKLPSCAAFEKDKTFSIGNILVLVKNGNYSVELHTAPGVKIAGYSQHISSRKKKSYICLYGIRFENALTDLFEELNSNNCNCHFFYLDEVKITRIHYPVLFICRACGNLFTCGCFQVHFNVWEDIYRFLPHSRIDPQLVEQAKGIRARKGICHLCRGGIPKLQYGSSMYYSPFLQRYLPYHELLSRERYGRTVFVRDREEHKRIEDELRERFRYPKIGDKRISEAALYQTLKMLFWPLEVVFHYRGRELEGLELDIWIPKLRLGIEYQGKQHFEVVKPWGGKKGLTRRRENDEKKKALCKKLGYRLVEFKFDEEITLEAAGRKLRRFIELKE